MVVYILYCESGEWDTYQCSTIGVFDDEEKMYDFFKADRKEWRSFHFSYFCEVWEVGGKCFGRIDL